MQTHGVIWHLPLLFLLKIKLMLFNNINLILHQELSDEFGDDQVIADIELLFDGSHKIMIPLQCHPIVF